MLDISLYFNWRGQGKAHRATVDMDHCVELLYGCLKLDNELQKLMGGAILSEAYGAFLIMMASHGIIIMPEWMPSQYRNPRHSFETGMDRLRYCAPALASELGSDPVHIIANRCLNNIPEHLNNTAPTTGMSRLL